MRIVTSNSAPAGRTYRLTQSERAARAAIERQMSRYIPLKCEHYTTPQDQLVYATWRPKGRGANFKFYCDICDDWVLTRPKPPREETDTPLF